MFFTKIDSFSKYLQENPGQSSYRSFESSDNPRLFYSYNSDLFYQENETDAYLFITRRDYEEPSISVIVHLSLELENKHVYIDDIYYEKYDSKNEVVESDYYILPNELIDEGSILNTVAYFLGKDFKITNKERSQQLTGEEWEIYETFNNERKNNM